MSVQSVIDTFISESEDKISQITRKRAITLYGEGVKSKLNQANYCITELQALSGQSDLLSTSTVTDQLNITDKVGFYSDSFWAFLFSSLDIRSHTINQSLKLNIDEKHVSFKKVVSHLETTVHNNSALHEKLQALKKSIIFRQTDGYRNCSTHRRQICIQERIEMITHTVGYTTSTAGVETVKRLLCDNPLETNPKINQNREIPDVMIKARNKIEIHIMGIIENITVEN